MARQWRRWFCAALLVVLVASCSSDSGGSGTGSTTSDGAPSGVLHYGASGDFASFDPHGGSLEVDLIYLRPVFDTLLEQEVAGGEILPGLATDWEVIDEKAVRLDLRSGVTFTDGAALDAEAVKMALERPTSGSTGTVWTPMTVEVVDEDTVIVTPETWTDTFLTNLTNRQGMVTSPNTTDFDREPIGSGPWVYDRSTSDEPIMFSYTLNDDYWDPDKQGVERIELRALADPSARVNALVSGEIDIALLDAANVPLAEDQGYVVVQRPTSTYGVSVRDRTGQKVEALGDPRVRLAMSLAIDRETFAENVLFGIGSVAVQNAAEGQPGFSAALEDEISFDPERAKELLAEAGYPDGFSFEVSSIQMWQTRLEAITGFWRDIGIDVKLTVLDPSKIADYATSTDEPLFVIENPGYEVLGMYEGSYMLDDPTTPATEGAQNLYQTEPPAELEALYEEAIATDPADQEPILAEMADYMYGQGDFIAVAHVNAVAGYDGDRLTNVTFTGGVSPTIYGIRVIE